MPTVTGRGVPPPGGVAVNQFPPEVVETPVVKAMGAPLPLLVTCTACVGGVAPLTVKVSAEELTVIKLHPPRRAVRIGSSPGQALRHRIVA